MDKQAYAPIIKTVESAITPKGFKAVQDADIEYYSNNSIAFLIDYDNSSKQIALKKAVLQEGEGVDFKVISSWLLDEGAAERDMVSIGNDFVDSINSCLGIKGGSGAMVDMPTKKKNVDSIDMENFTARFLAIYPALKAEYSQNVTDYGEFMYDTFYREFGVGELKTVLESGNKKQISKLLELLSAGYLNGEKTVSTTIVYTIMAGALLDEPALEKDAETYLEKYTYLKTATKHMLKLLSSTDARKRYMA